MKRGTPDHPKTKALARQLRIPIPYAVGILEMLWHFAAEFAPAGDIGRYGDDEIAEAVGWPNDRTASELIEALLGDVQSGRGRWIDPHKAHRFVIHDWPDHADDTVHRRLARNCELFSCGAIPSTKRLSQKEKDEVEGKLADLAKRAHGVRPKAPRRAHGVRPALPSLAKPSLAPPEPEPSVRTASPEPPDEPPSVPPLPPAVLADSHFRELVGVFLALGVPLSEGDQLTIAREWVQIPDDEQVAAAEYAKTQALGEWRARDERYIPRPWNYLREKHWRRRAPTRVLTKQTPKQRSMDEATARFLARHQGEA